MVISLAAVEWGHITLSEKLCPGTTGVKAVQGMAANGYR
jgi:hypothetical protein